MTPDQFAQLLTVLKQIVARPYTLTGAADWPLLAFLCVVIFALIGLMWRDLRALIQSNKTSNEKETDKIWKALSDCQSECCPRGKDGRKDR